MMGEPMFLRYLYVKTGLNHFHSTDLTDMRQALLDEDRDDNDGDSADVTARMVPPQRLAPDGNARCRISH